MTPRTRRLVVATSLCAGLSALADAQAPPPGTTNAPGLPPRAPSAPPAAKGTAVISGRILASDTGLPLRRARVMVHGSGPNFASGPDASRAAITDADGAFAFTELPAGRYYLQASKARYVDAAFGARRPNTTGRSIELAEGQKVENVTVSLALAGVITGRVVDELGEGVTGAQVVPMRATGSTGSPFMPSGMSDRTDDVGAYRLYGLQPGTYYVSAQGDDAMRPGIATANATPGFAPTFFPGTAVAAEAQAIDVVAGGEAVADITLVSVRLSAVSGVVVDAAGALATGGFISAQPRDGMLAFGGPHIGADIKPDGSFAMSGLAPGEYTVQARPTFEPREPFPSAGGRPADHRTVSMPIVVTGEPISGLRLVMPDPIRIPVAVTFEDATGRPPGEVRVYAQSEPTGGGEPATRGADGRLTLDLSPGTWRFSASASPPWIVKRLAYRGEDVESSEDIEVTNEPGGRLEVVFTTKSATVTGSVKDASGRPVADYLLFIAFAKGDPSDPASYDTFTSGSLDQDGRFKAERLRPGTYLFFATEESSPGRPGRGFADFRERALKAGARIHLRENESATLELTLTPLP